MRTACAMLAACLPLAVAGCGGEPSEAAEVADAYNALTAAIADEDYAEACEHLTPETRDDLRKAGQVQQTGECGTTLERVIADVGTKEDALSEVDASEVQVAGAEATVGQVRMSKASGEWLVEADLDFVRPLLSGSAAER